MSNQLKVSLENILPLTFARDHFSQIVSEVQRDKLFILTKGGKPAVAIIDVKYLESLTGGQIQPEDIHAEIQKAPEKVGLPPMIEHQTQTTSKPDNFAKPFVGSAPKPFTPPTPKPFTPPPPPPKPVTPPPPPPKPAGFAAPQTPKENEEKPKEEPKPFKPAGFAAPQPEKPKEEIKIPEVEYKPEPKPMTPPPPPPKPIEELPTETPKPEIPPQPKNEPMATAQPFNTPLTTPPTGGDTLTMPGAANSDTGIPNKPLTTLPPVAAAKPTPSIDNQVDVEFAPDGELSDQAKPANPAGGDPDDQQGPAQYSGPKNDEEPEDMVID